MTRRPLITLALVGTATIASASLATVTGASAASAVSNSAKHNLADQARRRALSGERLLRSLLRHVPECDQHRRTALQGEAGHAHGQRAHAGIADRKPERGEPTAARRGKRPHLRPGSQLHPGTTGPGRRPDGQVPDVHRSRELLATGHRASRAGHGLLRRQHRHGPLELRAAFRDERQRLRHDVRTVDAGRAQPRVRSDPRRDACGALGRNRQRHRLRRRRPDV